MGSDAADELSLLVELAVVAGGVNVQDAVEEACASVRTGLKW